MLVNVSHSVIKSSSQWVIGRNITIKFNINHIGGNKISFPIDFNNWECISMKDCNCISYIATDYVLTTELSSPNLSTLSAFSADVATNKKWIFFGFLMK